MVTLCRNMDANRRCCSNQGIIPQFGDLLSSVRHREHQMGKPKHKISNWKQYNQALMNRA